MLKIHHINCGTMHPFGGRAVDGFSHGLRARLVSHCWIVESNDGLVLVDTGFGEREITDHHFLSPMLRALLSPELTPNYTARQHVEKLGFAASDVKHVVLTQLGFGHSGGLAEFPNAKVHVTATELESASHPRTWVERHRYAVPTWSDKTHFETYAGRGQKWFGFDNAQPLRGLPGEMLLVPLPGHTWGHAGIAVKTDQGWMLHAGSAYFYREEVDGKGYRCPIGLRVFQNLTEVNHTQRWLTLKNLRRLVRQHSTDVRVCSSNDAIEFTAYQASAGPLRKLQSLNLSGMLAKRSLDGSL